MIYCDACETELSTIVEPCDDETSPYRLCSSCHFRLKAKALRPLEWYNLAKRHGWYQYHLHDDFYTDDGVAAQPIDDVIEAERFRAPVLEDVWQDPDTLLDYSVTRWNLDDETRKAWSALPISDVLNSLSTRFTQVVNTGIRSRILEICSSCAGEAAADFITHAWGEYPDRCDLISLAEASASCLPFNDGFNRVLKALAEITDERKIRDVMFCLGYFSSPLTLDWIEKHICSPITESWAYLAASSAVDWERIKAWFEGGRPMSLVAIDTLLAIQRLPTTNLKKRGVSLANPPTVSELKKVLDEYARKDPVPRVSQRINAILEDPYRITLSERAYG
jgi:hypothetical protein